MGTVAVHFASAGFAAKFLFLSVMPSAGEMFRTRNDAQNGRADNGCEFTLALSYLGLEGARVKRIH
jgi:hypothetical protein